MYIGVFLIWRPLPNSPNCQIKNLAKVFRYTVHVIFTTFIYSRSVDHPEFPAGRKFTRVDQYFSEMVIKPDSFIDEPGFNYELTYLDNPQISLPSSVVNWVTTTGTIGLCSNSHLQEKFLSEISFKGGGGGGVGGGETYMFVVLVST